MSISNARRLVCLALVVGFVQAASAGDILIADEKSQPESLTMAPGGVLIVGSASSPFVYRVRAGSSTAEKFIDASADILLGHVGGRLQQHVVDMSTDADTEHQSATAAYRTEKFRPDYWCAEDPLELAWGKQCLQRFCDWAG
jgi:hypothetical protein